MLDTTLLLPEPDIAKEKLGLNKGDRLLLLLPASRIQELRYLMPPLAKAAAILQQDDPSLEVLVPAGQASFEGPLQICLEEAGVKLVQLNDKKAAKSNGVLSSPGLTYFKGIMIIKCLHPTKSPSFFL